MFRHCSGFTLIELLVVIAIVAVLAVVVVLAMNPAELLRQARDSARLSDLATLSGAIQVYVMDVTGSSMGNAWECYVSIPTTTFAVPWWNNTPGDWGAAGWYPGIWSLATNTAAYSGDGCYYAFDSANGTHPATTTRNGQAINGTGWVPIDFTAISNGSPISKEPVDPVNRGGTCSGTSSTVSLSSCGLFYGYESGSGYAVESGAGIGTPGRQFDLTAFMESKKYSTGGSNDVETNSISCIQPSPPGSWPSDPYVYNVGTNNFCFSD